MDRKPTEASGEEAKVAGEEKVKPTTWVTWILGLGVAVSAAVLLVTAYRGYFCDAPTSRLELGALVAALVAEAVLTGILARVLLQKLEHGL